MIKGVVFDCFGVLTTDGWLPFKQRYFGADESLLQQASDLNRQADAGLINHDDFLQAVADLAGIAPKAASGEIENNVANEAMFEYIATLKPDYKIGMLSNAAANWLGTMFTPDQLALFDTTTLSFETGFIKPQIGAYETAAAQLGLTVDECVLVDDQERYCTGAKEIGMYAIQYHDAEQARTELAALLADSKH